MTTTIRVKTTNFKLLQPETAASLCSVFNQIDEVRRKRSNIVVTFEEITKGLDAKFGPNK